MKWDGDGFPLPLNRSNPLCHVVGCQPSQALNRFAPSPRDRPNRMSVVGPKDTAAIM